MKQTTTKTKIQETVMSSIVRYHQCVSEVLKLTLIHIKNKQTYQITVAYFFYGLLTCPHSHFVE